MMRRPYSAPRIVETRRLRPDHLTELQRSGIDFVTAAFAGVSSIDHGRAYDLGIRGDGDLSGLCFRYWDPLPQNFSSRFVRVKPDANVPDRKYLQPVGERPKLYIVAGTVAVDLVDTKKSVLITEGEKKVLALHSAAKAVGIPALAIGFGGVWSWRYSPKELQPDGSSGRGKSRPIEDLDLVQWTGRKTYLFFDSDVVTNWKVAVAETALARELGLRGAEVYIVRPGEGFK